MTKLAGHTSRDLFRRRRGGEVQQLTHILAWATAEGIPLVTALEAFQPALAPRLLLILGGSPFTGGPLAFFLYRHSRFQIALQRLIAKLRAGEGLSGALDLTMRQYLPDYYLAAVREAEDAQMLPQILPILARNVTEVRGSLAGFSTALMAYFAVSVTVISGVLVFIAPKFARMHLEMTGGDPGPMGAWTLIHGFGLLQLATFGLGMLLAAWYFWVFITRRSPLCRNLTEEVLMFAPLVRRRLRALARLRLGRHMLVALASGKDIVDAAGWCHDTTSSWWIQRRLRRLLEWLAAGERWDAAWEQMGLGGSLEKWMLSNSAQREKPEEGFAMLCQLLLEQLSYSDRKLTVVARFAFVLVTGSLVGTTIFAVFGMLTALIERCAEI